jgi:4-carboxymuconolactone decarboxylase
MARVEDVRFDEMNAEQREAAKEIAGSRGGAVRGPFAVWLRNPQLAIRASRLGDVLRMDGRLDKRLFELTVLIVARHWSAQYEWFVHAKHAADAGLRSEVIEALRTGQEPHFRADDEHIAYQFISELVHTKTIADSTYRRAVDCFGLDLVIELVAVAGFYTCVAMTLNAFDAPVPGGVSPLPR